MGRLPVVKAKKLIKVLKKLGFRETHRKGSHRFFQHSDGRTTAVPVHPGEDLGRGLLREILHQIEISPQEFLEHLKN